MTIQDLGSIGEFVASIATIATLIYLAAQIRLNTRMVEANSAAVHTSSSNAISTILGQDAQLCELYFDGLDGTFAFGPGQQKQFEMLVGIYLNHLQQSCELADQGVLSDALVADLDLQVDWIAAKSGFKEYWREWGPQHTPHIRDRVTRATSAQGHS